MPAVLTKRRKFTPMLPRVIADDPSVRPDYLAGTWSYAIGKPAIEHNDYDAAVRIAERGKWDAGWIRTWADVNAVERFGCRFDQDAGLQRAEFFPQFLRLQKGKYAGQSFQLLDFQKYDIIVPLFGWKGDDDLRRYTFGSGWMPKKNAKSTVCAGIGLILLIADKQHAPEVYTIAGDHNQAGIIHGESARYVKSNSELKRHLKVIDSTKTISSEFNDGVYRALSADADLREGVNWNGVLFDELHVQKKRRLFDTLRGGGISRENALFLSISTAGEYDQESIGWEEWQYNMDIRTGSKVDPSYFAVCYHLPKEQLNLETNQTVEVDWHDPDNWKRANPGWGITFLIKEFEKLHRQAENSPAKQSQFRRYHLNQWMQEAEKWINIELWEKCDGAVDELALEGRDCYGGFDGAAKHDLNSFCLVFPPEHDDEPVKVISRSWVPRGCIEKRVTEDKVPYDLWIEQGWLEALQGKVIDQRHIIQRIIADGRRFNIKEIAFDPAWARTIEAPLLDEGFEMVEFIQSTKNYNNAMTETESLLVEGKIAHGGNPVLRKAIENMVVRENHNKEQMPDRGAATDRIDPGVAFLEGMARMILHRSEKSMYETEKPSAIRRAS